MVIWVDPVPVTLELVTSIVSNVELSDVFLIVMFPVSTSTFSLKFKIIFASSATSVALSDGLDELNDGLVLDANVAVVKHNRTRP